MHLGTPLREFLPQDVCVADSGQEALPQPILMLTSEEGRPVRGRGASRPRRTQERTVFRASPSSRAIAFTRQPRSNNPKID